MTTPTKPILHNGFKVRDDLVVKIRIERIFFTEVYELSDGKFLYLFTNMRPEEVIDRGEKYDLIIINNESKKYLGVISGTHSREELTDIIDNLTNRRIRLYCWYARIKTTFNC